MPDRSVMMDLDGHVTATDEASAASKRLNLRRSCEACRGSKGRCISSPNDAQRCMRCLKDGKRCVFLEAKPRPKRTKNSRVRVAEMEEKLESLLALVAANAAHQSVNLAMVEASVTNESSFASPALVPRLSMSQEQPTVNATNQIGNMSTTATESPPESYCSSMLIPDSGIIEFTSSYNTPPSSSNQSEQSFPQQDPVFMYPIFDNLQDAISKGFISPNQAEDALRIFRSKQSAFPFVVIPMNMSLDSLRRQRPFLFLAIMCCATEHSAKLQKHIELELRENLSRRILVNGEKSLDLLQGILIYLTWYHFYFHPDREQIYRLSQMAVAMVVDLGLDKPLRQVQTGLNTSDIIPFIGGVHPLPSAAEIEAMRAYLGCYFLVTSICQGLRKPSNMKYNQHVKLCTKNLADAGVAETDYLIPYIIRIRQLSEEVGQAFNYDSSADLLQLDCVRTEILGRAFEQQLDHMEATFPRDIWDNAPIKLSFHHLRIYVNEVGFHATTPPELDLMSRLAAPSWYHSAARNDCLMRCLKASKTYLDHFLRLSDIEISSLVTTDLLQVVYTTLVLGSFSTGFDAPTLDQNKVRQVANLNYYLDAIGIRFARLIAAKDPAANIYMHHFSILFQTSKMWYLQMTHDPSPSEHPRFYFTDIIATMTGRCADFAPVEAISETSTEEQWTELLSEWVASSSMDPSLMSGDGTMIQFQA